MLEKAALKAVFVFGSITIMSEIVSISTMHIARTNNTFTAA